MYASEARRCLLELDVGGIRRLSATVSPHLPQPTTDHEALFTLHMARLDAKSIPPRLRAYSRQWLVDHGRVEAVGISVNFRGEGMKPAEAEVRGAMEDAVLDAYAEGRQEPEFVKIRMMEAKAKAQRKLFG